MKVAINRRAGGFCLSEAAYKKMGLEWDGFGFVFSFCDYGYISPPGSFLRRTDERLIECVEELGREASGRNAHLEVIDIPDNVGAWTITSLHGLESVVEITGRVWTAQHEDE